MWNHTACSSGDPEASLGVRASTSLLPKYFFNSQIARFMPKSSSRLSAVAARRRRLQYALEQPEVAGNINTEYPQVDNVNNVSTHAEDEFHKDPKTKVDVSKDTSATSNQFSSLVATGQVSFSSIREIEHVNGLDLKVRLARSQKCVILGVCSLWIKEGTIAVSGAILSASAETHHVYAPNTHALPVIEAITKSAEFELASVHQGLHQLPNIGTSCLWAPSEAEEMNDQTFYVLDHSFSLDLKSPNKFRELDLSTWNSAITHLSSRSQVRLLDKSASSKTLQSSHFKRILITGRSNAGVSTFSRCQLNRMVTARTTSGDLLYPHGVVLLDLETIKPEFAFPGVLALLNVTQPVLGPPVSHQLKYTYNTSPGFRAVKMHFIGEHDHDFVADWIFGMVLDLLQEEHTQRSVHNDCPLIINVPSWFQKLSATQTTKLWALMTPTDVVYVELSSSQASISLWQPFIDRDKCAIHHVQTNALLHKYNSTREHELQAQSYLHIDSYLHNQPQWYSDPILSPLRKPRPAQYVGGQSAISAILLLTDSVTLEATHEALEHSLVAVVAITKTQFEKLEANIVRTELEDLPRFMHTPGKPFPVSAVASSFRGMAYVHRIDIGHGQLWLSSTVCAEDWLSASQQEQVLGLVIPRATTDGRFTSHWVQKEVEQSQGHMSKDERKLESERSAAVANSMQLE